MRTTRQAVLGLVMTVVCGALAACGAGSGAPTGPELGASAAGGSDDNPANAGAATSGTAAATLRIRCETRPGRAKISVDGNNLSPRNGTFTARVTSGANSATAGAKQAIGDEAEFDFDSEAGERGATRIAASFIVGRTVTAAILGAGDQVVVSGSAQCEAR